MMDDIQLMRMEFTLYKVVDMKTARELLVYSVEEYLSDINSNEKVRPYLHDYPFTAKNIDIAIFFYKPDGYKVPPNEIKIAAANEGTVEYFIDDPKKNTIKTIYEESYQDALKIVSNK